MPAWSGTTKHENEDDLYILSYWMDLLKVRHETCILHLETFFSN